MEGGVLLGVSCATGFVCSFLFASAVEKGVSRAYAAVVVHASASGDGPTKDPRAMALLLVRYYVRNGIASFSKLAQVVTRSPLVLRALSDAAGLLRRRGWDATPESMASLCAAACCVASGVAVVAFKTLLSAILVPACLVLAASVAVSQGRAKEQELIRDQVPDALRCMEACLHAGLSLPQAFSEVAQESKQPLKESFVQVKRDIDLGFSVQDALERFHGNAGVEELGFVAMALDVQYVCGGSATPVLHAAQDSIARGLELRRSLRVQTAQARFSAQVVSVLPVFLLAVLSVVSPGFLSPFFADARGMALLVVAACMQVAGIVLVRRMLAIAP